MTYRFEDIETPRFQPVSNYPDIKPGEITEWHIPDGPPQLWKQAECMACRDVAVYDEPTGLCRPCWRTVRLTRSPKGL